MPIDDVITKMRARARPVDGDEWVEQDAHSVITVIPGLALAPRVLFSSKPYVLLKNVATTVEMECAIIGYYGVLSNTIIEYMHMLRGHRIIEFVGDLDPLDLTVFAQLQATGAVYRGIDSRWLEESIIPALIPMTPFEREHWVCLQQHVPDVRHWIGAASCAVLDGGNKVELEGGFLIAPEALHRSLRLPLP